MAISARGQFQPGAAALEFGIGLGHLQAKRHRFGMNAVRAADANGVLVFKRALFQRRKQIVQPSKQKVGGPGELHIETGIENVGGCHALVNVSGVLADDFGKMGQEGDNIMLGLALDFVDAGDIECRVSGLVPDVLCRGLGNDAALGQSIAGMRLDFEPDAKFALRRPNRHHVRAGIAGDHGILPCFVEPAGRSPRGCSDFPAIAAISMWLS